MNGKLRAEEIQSQICSYSPNKTLRLVEYYVIF